MSVYARRYHPERIEYILTLQAQGLSQTQALRKASEHFGVSYATLNWELSFYKKSQNQPGADIGHYRKQHPAYRNMKTPYRGEIFQTDRWAFADQLRKMHDEGMCLEALSKQFKIRSGTIAEYIELSKTFPKEFRYKFFPTTLYRGLLKFDDPTKALEIAVRLKKEAPDSLYSCIKWHRKPSNGKIPVDWLEERASKVLSPEPQAQMSEPSSNSSVDLEWIKELQERVAELERDLASARKLNFIYLSSLERINRLRQVSLKN